MKKLQLVYTPLLIFILMGLMVASCVKKDFDAPPDNSNFDPGLSVTNTIASIQTLPNGTQIMDDIIISGIVNIDDKSGNYYKKITIEDETGGIEILLDQNNLYNDYPVGRKIYVRLKGMYKGDYKGIPQLGYIPDGTGALSNVPFTLIDQFIVKANYPNQLNPDTFTLAELSNPDAVAHLINKLVVIKDAEFTEEAMNQTYAEPAVISSATNRELQECSSGIKMVVRTSGYAKFQPEMTPVGNGTITAVYTRYNATPQLIIRDTADVQFNQNRCDGSTPTPMTTLFFEDFSSLADNAVINLTGWTNYSEAGSKDYIKKTYSGTTYAQISAFGGTVPASVINWLITPAIDITGLVNPTLFFKTKDGYDNGATLKVLISKDYVGSGDPNLATWTALSAPISNGTATGYAANWLPATVVLTQDAPVYIAFKYEGGTGKTTTYQITDIKVAHE